MIREKGPEDGVPGITLGEADGTRLIDGLFAHGYARIDGLVPPVACRRIRSWYEDPTLFRTKVVMERYNFGVGEYAYFAAPLPPPIDHMRVRLYEWLVPVANWMMEALGQRQRYPPKLSQFLARCRAAGQTQPTPLLLRYDAGGMNCLHRDLYGPMVFPLQVMVMLSRPGRDFQGGEFVLVENRPRQQSRAVVLQPGLGDAVVFPVSDRPVRAKRGVMRAAMRHGVSRVHQGRRFTLGVIFHDAK